MGGSKSNKPIADELRKLVNYDPATGIVTAKVRLSGHCAPGDEVGSLHHTGCLNTKLKGRHYILSRLIYCWMTGEWPTRMIDHKNRDRKDNRWGNLRLATNGQNRANSISAGITTGTKGVWLRKRYKTGKPRYVSQITINGKCCHLGHFDTLEAASVAYRVAAEKAFGQFARV